MKYKYLLGIFISFTAVFLMSHNSFALNDLSRSYRVGGNTTVNQLYVSGSFSTPRTFFGPTQDADIYGVRWWEQYNLQGGTYGFRFVYEFDILQGTGWQVNNVPITMDFFRSGDAGIWQSVLCSYVSTSGNYLKYHCQLDSDTPNIILTGVRLTFGYVDSIGDIIAPAWQSSAFAVPSGSMALQNRAYTFDVINSPDTAILGDISDKVGDIINIFNDYNSKEDEAVDNISNQSPSDIDSGDDSSATNLIGVISGFLSYITNFQAGTCVVTLPFPSFTGGSWQMNLCQFKDKAGQLVSVFSSLTMIVFFIPICWKLLNMIYNEIRSFTNG